MDLSCYEVEPGRVELRPAGNKRQWMDETPSNYAYRCLPINAANAHGWEMLCPVGFEATWNGGQEASDIEIHTKEILGLREQLNKILSTATGQKLSKIEKDTDRNFFMGADEAMKYGLVDKIMHRSDDKGKKQK